MPHQILLSHCHRDKGAANSLATLIRRTTLNQIDVWLSSDSRPEGGVSPGERWFDSIRKNLETSRCILALITPNSLRLPWLYFEVGYAAAKEGMDILPVCVGIDSLSGVPHPLALYQAYQLRDAESANDLMKRLCSKFQVPYDPEMAKVVIERCMSEMQAGQTAESKEAAPPQAALREEIPSLPSMMRHLPPGDLV